MRHLLGVELTRLRWRRAVVLLVASALLLPLLILAGTAWETRPVSEAELAGAREKAAEEASQPWVVEDLRRCEEHPDEFGVGHGATSCEEAIVPRPENYLFRYPIDLEQMVKDTGVVVVVLVAIILFIVVTTYAGHDWSTGSMSNQMLFEPRRLRVWSAKALAVSLTALVVGTVAVATFWVGAGVVAAARGIDTDSEVWRQIVWFSVRGVALVVAAALAGYALTMLFRSTVATLVVAFLAVAAAPMLAMGAFTELAMPWLLPPNAAAVLQDGYHYYLWQSECIPTPNGDPCERTLSLTHGAAYLASLLSLIVISSAVSFRRRDLP